MEELANSLDFTEGSSLTHLKSCLQAYVDSPDEESVKTTLETEIQRIMEIVDSKKKE